ncbi:MAG: hypothetical protein QF436_04190 [Candidatus Woesearchaeota archaeon]|jgi:hypothetical protein|nr:hypothetical protein [Candidatus Paceibacterota bacterium]MDP7623284.1 hypothetical protein [Candidatus Woesearchaeota archaeon]|tara:strand:+ start:283 stop:459 length:177 start_codon:yes stop_codon:yes gene_type:complete
MITPAKYIADKIFELDMPIEQFLPRQQMIIKRQVLDILVEWQAEWEAERAKWMRRQEL